MLRIAVVLEESEGGGFTASVPTLPGCFSEGETIEETMRNVREAIELIVEATEDDLIVAEGAIIKEILWRVFEEEAVTSGEQTAPGEPAAEPDPSPSPPRRRIIRPEQAKPRGAG
jgi:predicted RNase H-like HicB family nuclease